MAILNPGGNQQMVPVQITNSQSQSAEVSIPFVQLVAMMQGPGPLGNFEMIPILQVLNSLDFLHGSSGTDLPVLAKRLASQVENTQLMQGSGFATVVQNSDGKNNKQKRWKVMTEMKLNRDEWKEEEVGKHMECVEATSLGAAGQLTGTHDASRQGQ
jgi:hypothetical protein